MTGNQLALLGGLAMSVVSAPAMALELSSPDFAQGGTVASAQVFNDFGCQGGDKSPALTWKGEPAGTKSFAVTMFDPDAPSGSGWWHWTVFNLPASVHSLPGGIDAAGAGLPAGAGQGRTDFGTPGYSGSCPPQGDKPHRYQITVWALKVDHLQANADSPGAWVGYLVRGNALGQAMLTATYGR